jgi:hypothetical protein
LFFKEEQHCRSVSFLFLFFVFYIKCRAGRNRPFLASDTTWAVNIHPVDAACSPENSVSPWDEAIFDLQRRCVVELAVEIVCGGFARESIVRLVTGRMHTIRLQIGAER